MRVPKRVKIVRNSAGTSDYYDQFIGEEYEVLFYDEYENEVTLPIASEFNNVAETVWMITEVEVLEWDEAEE